MTQNNRQKFDVFLVLDFEATCSDTDPKFQHEIIEFPIVALDGKNGKIISEFREYVRPVINKKLTDFCTTLTGIEQSTVDNADTFSSVFSRAQEWYKQFHLDHPDVKTVFVTCGDWDLQRMLPAQARLSNVKVPSYFQQWINVKIPFRETVKDFPKGKSGGFGMASMLRSLNLELKGRHHSGLDDSRNIAAIAYELIKRGIQLDVTTEWSDKQKRNNLSIDTSAEKK